MHHPNYQEISRRFRHTKQWSDETALEFPGENVDLFHLEFNSSGSHYLLGRDSYRCEEHGLDFPAEPSNHIPYDCDVDNNVSFRYSLVREHQPQGVCTRHNRAILLLHGLNERSFTKYISWAYQLWAGTRAPVLLFPLSFHINRVHPSWSSGQQGDYALRIEQPGNQNCHRFNATISDRLGTHPERFFWGAIQSYWDIIELVQSVRAGNHRHLAPDTRFDILAFSAGGFIALDVMLENYKGLFSDSRAVLFATCCALRNANLSSHLIVDQCAEISIMNLFVKHQDKLSNGRLAHWLHEHSEGKWLQSLCGLRPDRKLLEPRLKELAPRLLGIANSNDLVIPAGAMFDALQGLHRETGVRVMELDLGIHENPFSCPGYDERDRSMITEFLDLDRYGKGFEEFINMSVRHFVQ
jgi:hypothetical protein